MKNIKLGKWKYHVITKGFYTWVVWEIMLPMSNYDTIDIAGLQDIKNDIKTAKKCIMTN